MDSMIPADAEAGPTSHSFISQRLRLNYVDWGNAGAPILLLLHGGRDHARSWDLVAHALRRDYHIVCPDLRGHGDSAWSPDAAYTYPFFISDLAQLVHQLGQRVRIVAHSLGGAIALRYAGLFPETVDRIAAIEGIGLPEPERPVEERLRGFVEERRALSAKTPRRYATIADGVARMRAENKHLSEAQARHLTIHGMIRGEDGSFSWKFDNYLRAFYPVDLDEASVRRLWRRIEAPTWLVHGADSWAEPPQAHGRAAEFRDASITSYAGAGHWVHHDRLADFVADLRDFMRD
jgi:pimeloyl-ACP methyl ester carboxylesterase